jgi:hypothetical protein
MHYFLALFFWVSEGLLPAYADSPAPNRQYTVKGHGGNCSALVIPFDSWKKQGVTLIYDDQNFQIPDVGDAPYPSAALMRYSHSIEVFCNQTRLIEPPSNKAEIPEPPRIESGVSVIVYGPWSFGHQASKDHIAFQYYWVPLEGEPVLLKTVSTLDIAGNPDNVQATVSHYFYGSYGKPEESGCIPNRSCDYILPITTVDGKKRRFRLSSLSFE